MIFWIDLKFGLILEKLGSPISRYSNEHDAVNKKKMQEVCRLTWTVLNYMLCFRMVPLKIIIVPLDNTMNNLLWSIGID